MAHPTVATLESHFAAYRRSWRSEAVTSLLQPLLLLLAFGVGLGGFVGDIGGVRYLDYVAPAMIAASALQMAATDASYPVRARMSWQRSYHVQIAAPLRVGDVLGGHVAFLMCRVAASSTAFLLVIWVAGAVHSITGLAVVPIAVLVGLAGALPTFAFSVMVGNATYIELIVRAAVLPMTLFAGVFFPVQSLPLVVRPLAYASPLWHAVDLSRAATLGQPAQWSVPGHILYLAAWAGVGWILASRAFRAKLLA